MRSFNLKCPIAGNVVDPIPDRPGTVAIAADFNDSLGQAAGGPRPLAQGAGPLPAPFWKAAAPVFL